ncbi:hypothetical protein [Arthrobacter sp. MMS18-M83]|uniref:hypothetical protein n=1 Tax=Arthrobacter sp. MMS18-M83 TaxID=2996261 RepID=UPI00227C414C|nr:hypothetical protein [Arthrobacter sp. MMS18-M83]WAH98502.1 hypothetical protein OW521_06525 [Arthrobacter sp. MMS18-M83]
MKRAAKAGIVVAGVVAVGLAGAITLNATQTGSRSIQGGTTPVTASATPSASAAANAPSATPGAATPTPAANASPSAAPSSQAPAPAPTASSKPEAPAAPVPAPAEPAPAAPAPGAQGLDGAGIQRIEDTCTARLQSDAAHSGTVTGTVVPRPFIVVSIAFSGTPVRSTGASGLPAYDVLMKTTIKLADGPAQDGQRVCRVYDADAHVVDWLPVG